MIRLVLLLRCKPRLGMRLNPKVGRWERMWRAGFRAERGGRERDGSRGRTCVKASPGWRASSREAAPFSPVLDEMIEVSTTSLPPLPPARATKPRPYTCVHALLLTNPQLAEPLHHPHHPTKLRPASWNHVMHLPNTFCFEAYLLFVPYLQLSQIRSFMVPEKS